MAFLSSTEREQVTNWWLAGQTTIQKMRVQHYAYACDNPKCHFATEFPERFKPVMPFVCRKCGCEISIN